LILPHRGNGVPRDRTEALSWFRKTAEQGDLDARLHRLAAQQGNEEAPKDLDRLKAAGVDPDTGRGRGGSWRRTRGPEEGEAEGQLDRFRKSPPFLFARRGAV